MATVKAAIKQLEKAFPKISGIKPLDEWDGRTKGAIFLGDVAEGGEIDGIPACDYYAEDPHERVYVMHVHRKLRDKLQELGFYPECYDPGTWMAFPS